jgi:hypothetical protein
VADGRGRRAGAGSGTVVEAESVAPAGTLGQFLFIRSAGPYPHSKIKKPPALTVILHANTVTDPRAVRDPSDGTDGNFHSSAQRPGVQRRPSDRPKGGRRTSAATPWLAGTLDSAAVTVT